MILSKDQNLSKKSLLIVEDDKSSRSYLRLILNNRDFDVIEAHSGEDAIREAFQHDVDGLLVDIALGSGITGLDFGLAIKQDSRYEKTPMIAVTAYDRSVLGDIKERGFTGYLQKPYSPQDLWSILEKQVT